MKDIAYMVNNTVVILNNIEYMVDLSEDTVKLN